MEEAEVNYASVVFKSNRNPEPKAIKMDTVNDEVKGQSESPKQTSDSNAKKEEETVYDEVKGQHKTSEQAADRKVSAGFLQDKKDENNRRHNCQRLACCLGILCVILLCGIIAMMVYIALRQESDVSELKQLKDNQRTLLEVNLTNHNKQLHSEITKLTTQIQELESQTKNLTEQIRDMETKWKEQNVTRAQWSIDAYCSTENNGRKCNACRSGWLNHTSSCYAINNAKRSVQKTWEEAREDCRGKNSDLAVIVNEAEQKFTTDNSWKKTDQDIAGYWIGLKLEDGRWKWVDGSDLTESLWIEPRGNGRCAISLQGQRWQSVSCDKKNAWICQQKALSV